MSLRTDSVLIVIPVYNHGKTLRRVVQAALATSYAVLVVDDGSNDDGVLSLTGLACQVETLSENRGKGAAIMAAARIAKDQGYTAIVTVDADGQHDPAEVERLVSCAAAGPWPAIVVGAREMVQDTVPASSRFGRSFSNFWVRLECGAELSDTQSGMRLYPVDILLQQKFSRTRYDFEIEALVKSVWAGVPVRSVTVSVHYPPPEQRISHFRGILDNWRLTLLHTGLVFRRLLPFPHGSLLPKEKTSPTKIRVKRPFATLARLCRENTSPFWIALAVWLGIFIGALPIFGFHLLVLVYLCYRLHINVIAAVAANQLCMPPVVPAICIELGFYMQNGSWLTHLTWETWLLEIHLRLWDWFLGSLFVGPVLGAIVACIVYGIARRFQAAPLSAGGAR